MLEMRGIRAKIGKIEEREDENRVNVKKFV